jgi:hypothetical protein
VALDWADRASTLLCVSAKRERKDFDTGIKEFNLKRHLFDRALLPDKLIHPRQSNLARAVGAGIASMIGAGGRAVQLKRTGALFFAGPKTIWRSRLWNRNIILPGADSSAPLSAPARHDPPSPH